MKKSAIALVVAATFTSSIAQAGAFGMLKGSVASDSDGILSFMPEARIGFKGQEALKNGMASIYKIEMKVDENNSKALAATRDAFGGLKGSFGTLVMGRMQSGTAKVADINDTFLTKASTFKSNGGRGNAVAYISPNMNGISAAISLSADGEEPFTSACLSAGYSNGPIAAGIAYGVEAGALSLSLRYGPKPWAVGYTLTRKNETDEVGHNIVGSYKFAGVNTLNAGVTVIGEDTKYGAEVIHALSDKSSVGVGIGTSGSSLTVRHNF